MKQFQFWRVALPLAVVMLAGVFFWLATQRTDSDPGTYAEMETRTVMSMLGSSVEFWQKDHGRVPTAEEGLSVLEIKNAPVRDGWGHEFIYEPEPSNMRRFHLRSMGPNGRDDQGGGDDLVFGSDR